MSQNHDSSLGPLLAAFLTGAAVGAIIVALTTPKRGDELRDDLGELFERLRDNLDSAGEPKPQPRAEQAESPGHPANGSLPV